MKLNTMCGGDRSLHYDLISVCSWSWKKEKAKGRDNRNTSRVSFCCYFEGVIDDFS